MGGTLESAVFRDYVSSCVLSAPHWRTAPTSKGKKSRQWYFLGTGPSVTDCENIHWARGPGLFYGETPLSPPRRGGMSPHTSGICRCPPVSVILPPIRGLGPARSLCSTSRRRCSSLPAVGPAALMLFTYPCRGSCQGLARVCYGLQEGTLPSRILSRKCDGISLTGNTTFSIIKFPNTNANWYSHSLVNVNEKHPTPAASRKVLDCWGGGEGGCWMRLTPTTAARGFREVTTCADFSCCPMWACVWWIALVGKGWEFSLLPSLQWTAISNCLFSFLMKMSQHSFTLFTCFF